MGGINHGINHENMGGLLLFYSPKPLVNGLTVCELENRHFEWGKSTISMGHFQ